MMVLVPVGCIPPEGHADYTRVKELAREKVLRSPSICLHDLCR